MKNRDKVLRRLANHAVQLNAYVDPLVAQSEIRPLLREVFVEPIVTDPSGRTVRPQQVLEKESAAIIVGAPGSGKTTLLRFFANLQGERFLAGQTTRCPILFSATALGLMDCSDSDFLSLVAHYVTSSFGSDESESAIRRCTHKITVFVDGLDELRTNARSTVVEIIKAAPLRYPHLQLVISSRPAGISHWSSPFAHFYLAGFTPDAVARFVANSSPKDASRRGEAFMLALHADDNLAELAKNPLLLTLLWQTFLAYGRLASSPAFLYADISDYLLSSWNRRKRVPEQGLLSIDELQSFLQKIAVYQFEQQKQTLTYGDLLHFIHSCKEDSTDDSEEIFRQLLTTGILVEVAERTVSFVDRSFLEYYIAKGLSTQPRRLISALDTPNGNEIVQFACGIMPDVGPLVEAALERRLLFLAAKCISMGRVENRQLAHRVAHEFRRELGDRFVSLISERRDQGDPQGGTNSLLLKKWRLVHDVGLVPVEKGRRLEDFARAFFGQFFNVVSSDLNTEDGEIDVILENRNTSPFWLAFGSDIFVECKNWNAHAPLHELGVFTYKAARFAVRLAFFLAVSGFTEDALRTARNQAISSNGPLIIPLTGDEVEQALQTGEVLEEFLKRQIRTIKYLQKY